MTFQQKIRQNPWPYEPRSRRRGKIQKRHGFDVVTIQQCLACHKHKETWEILLVRAVATVAPQRVFARLVMREVFCRQSHLTAKHSSSASQPWLKGDFKPQEPGASPHAFSKKKHLSFRLPGCHGMPWFSNQGGCCDVSSGCCRSALQPRGIQKICRCVPEKTPSIPSRELTYPTWGKGKSSSKCHFWGIC